MVECQCGKVRECKVCQRRYNQDWYRRNKTSQLARARSNATKYLVENREYVRQLKSQPCTDCGRSYHWYAMDFDHVRGTKTKDISLMLREHPLERIKEEIAKCDVVCATCHRLRTVRRVESGELSWSACPRSSVG